MFTKIQNGLNKFVGPNAAHIIDALLAAALTYAIAFVASPAARSFETTHAQLGLILLLVPPVGTALASKFRKAAGQPATDIAAQVAAVVRAELATFNKTTTPQP